VVVTGIGTITPIGSTKESFWDSLKNGKGGIDTITRFDTSEYPVHIAAEVNDFDPLDFVNKREARHMDLFTRYAMGAGIQAVNDSAIDFDKCNRDRVGVIIGSGIGGMGVYEEQLRKLMNRGPRRVSPFFIPMLISDIAAGQLSIRYNLRGPNYATISACATSGHSIGCAMKAIRYGDADVVLTGGTEAPIVPTGLSGFCALKALSTRNDDPQKASRPFDAERDGFIMGEGAGMLLLEELEHALKRNAHIYGEVAGVGFTGDAHHITAPPEDGHGAVRSMKVALEDAELEIEQIDYINAHGTSTPLNDKSETSAIRQLFGDRADELMVSSSKSMHGHLLGAAGAVELIVTLLAIENELIPPTINYEVPDPDCDLDYVPNMARKAKIDAALSNTFGFGGHNATIAVKRFI